MLTEIDQLGADWIVDEVGALSESVLKIKPSVFSEEKRYLPASVTPIPGYMRFSVNPFMREIVDCFDPDSPVREVNLMKGVQITYTTALESIIFYAAAHLKAFPMCLATAERDLATDRLENNILPMFDQSGLSEIIKSNDDTSARKSGRGRQGLQFSGGGVLRLLGANNAKKMRQASIAFMLKDELDGWPLLVGRDGDPDKLTDDRCAAYWAMRKIFRGSTPLEKITSKIYKQYKRGDQRKYMVRCKHCNYQQAIRWHTEDKDTGIIGGMVWELDDGVLIPDSVAWCCAKCGGKHFEHDKTLLLSDEHGAEWVPTARPVAPDIRSYHLPALYSPVGMQPWSKSVLEYLDAYDPVARKVKDIGKYQVFYNNVLGAPFDVVGDKVRFQQVSAHRRQQYMAGMINNTFIQTVAGGPAVFVTCQVDVQKSNLAVATMAWARDQRCFLVDYWRLEGDDCTDPNSPVWGQLRKIIDEKEYHADDGKIYRVALTLVDAGYAMDTVLNFCADYQNSVYPILGRERPAKAQTILEFGEFTTKVGTRGFRITVDHYKDRMAVVLRREWDGQNTQPQYHFNAPLDSTDAQLTELTKETRKRKTDEYGRVSYVWHRPQGADNELWDLLGYGYAAVEIAAYMICREYFELETVDWPRYWNYLEDQALFYHE